jgi:Trk-type K+ transport system membrane component
MFWLEIREFSRHRQPRWGWIVLLLLAVVLFALMVLVLVSTGDFGDGSTTPVPSTPGSCQPFCTGSSGAPSGG